MHQTHNKMRNVARQTGGGMVGVARKFGIWGTKNLYA